MVEKEKRSYCLAGKIFLMAIFSTFAVRMEYIDTGSLFSDIGWKALAEGVSGLFSYDIHAILLVILFCIVYSVLERKVSENAYTNPWLSGFLAFCMVMGGSYYYTNSWNGCLGAKGQLFKGLAAWIGYFYIISYMLKVLWRCFAERKRLNKITIPVFTWLFGSKSFLKCTCILLLLWIPIAVMCYPGGSCVDVSYQINQVLGEYMFSNYQPLAHTLLVGGLVKLGEVLFHSYNLGFFLYILMQMIILALVLAYSIQVLKKAGTAQIVMGCVFGVYLFSPMYSNFATMAIKDTLFNAFVLLYIIFLTRILDAEDSRENTKMFLLVGGAAVLAMLFRNNGVYLVLGGNLAAVIYLLHIKRHKKRLWLLLVPFAMYALISVGLTSVLRAETVPAREVLSIPLQQTARYCRDYGWDITAEEKESLENLLGEYEQLGSLYNPDISDPVKARMKNDATTEQIVDYLGVWIKQLFRHPDVYFQAGLNHAYGWFYPGASNSIRYEGLLPIFSRMGIFEKTNHLVNKMYSFLGDTTVFGFLENPGCYIWLLLIASSFMKRMGGKKVFVTFVPCYVSLLICIASPAFFLHPRYAFPIMFTLPFILGRYSNDI